MWVAVISSTIQQVTARFGVRSREPCLGSGNLNQDGEPAFSPPKYNGSRASKYRDFPAHTDYLAAQHWTDAGILPA